jgi:UDP-N-acetyl-D-mannosaminuronic acid transferase (WecB/TagA/CpsF family)
MAMTSKLRVAFVGGVECVDRQLVALGDELGIEVEVHHGHMKSQSKQRLVSLIARTHVLVLVTGVNSHGAVSIAKREAERFGTEVRIVKFCGSSKARALLSELAQARAA